MLHCTYRQEASDLLNYTAIARPSRDEIPGTCPTSDDTAQSATGAGGHGREGIERGEIGQGPCTAVRPDLQRRFESVGVHERRWSTVDTKLQEVFDMGRRTGHAEAVVAVYGVLEQYRGDEHHATWMALMDAVKAIQECRTES